MDPVNRNIRYLRQQKNMTQQAFAEWLGITRSSLGAYEEGRAKPNWQVLRTLSERFDLSLDRLLQDDLAALAEQRLKEDKRPGTPKPADPEGKSLRVLSITVDSENRENIELVPEKAAAGYLAGYADPEYLKELPRFRLPNLPEGTYRAFEITGDSMLPIPSGSVIIGEYVTDWTSLREGLPYIVVSKRDGIAFKRVFRQPGNPEVLVMQSDNPAYPAYELRLEEIMEMWQARAYISTIFPDKDVSLARMMEMVMELQQEVIRLKGKS